MVPKSKAIAPRMQKDPETNENATRATRVACGALAIIASSRTFGKGQYVLCSHCGNEIKEGAKFCTFCGKSLAEPVKLSQGQTAECVPDSPPASSTIKPDPDATLTVLDYVDNPGQAGTTGSRSAQDTPAMQDGYEINFSPISGSQRAQMPSIPQTNHTDTVFQPPSGSSSNPFNPPKQQHYQYPQPDPVPSRKTDTRTIVLLAIACVLFAILVAAGIYFAIG